MGTSLLTRIIVVAASGALYACGSGLTLPGDGSPATLTAVSGGGQQGTVGTRLDDSLVVRVTDANSRAIAGVPVVFHFESETAGGEVDPAEPTTNAEGLAAAQVRLGANTGTHIVEALVAEASAPEL